MRSQAFLRELAGFANINIPNRPKEPMAGRLPEGTIGRVIMLGATQDPFIHRDVDIAVVRAEMNGEPTAGMYHYIISALKEGIRDGLKSVAIPPEDVEDTKGGIMLRRPGIRAGSMDVFVPFDRTAERARIGNTAIGPFMEVPDAVVFGLLDSVGSISEI
jgi:hypothetical protein